MSKDQDNAVSATPNPTREEKAVASAYIAQARQQYATLSSDFEIDGEPQVSIAEDGAWVAAWVWVAKGEAGLPKQRRACAASI
jgi:hypothetical protein